MTEREIAAQEITEREREVPAARPPGPHAVVWRLLRDREQRDTEARDRVRTAERSVADLADDTGVVAHKLREFVRISGPVLEAAGLAAELGVLRSLGGMFGAALRRAGAHVVEPTGLPYAEVADLVDVLAAQPGVPHLDLVVTATVQAGLRMESGELVRRAVVELGAGPPPPPAPGH